MIRRAGLAAAFAVLAIAAPAHAWAPRPATYDVAKQTNVPITMSDGVRLYADVVRPALKDGSLARRCVA